MHILLVFNVIQASSGRVLIDAPRLMKPDAYGHRSELTLLSLTVSACLPICTVFNRACVRGGCTLQEREEFDTKVLQAGKRAREGNAKVRSPERHALHPSLSQVTCTSRTYQLPKRCMVLALPRRALHQSPACHQLVTGMCL